MKFQQPLRTKGPGLRPALRTTAEAIRLIDEDIPQEVRTLSRWTFARALLSEAERSQKKRDLKLAERQLKQALSNESWLVD
jgi:hypothetical protein